MASVSSAKISTIPAEQAEPVAKRRVVHLPEEILARIRARADELDPELIEFRRDMHANPELSRHEHRATKKIAEKMRAAGLHVHLMTDTGLWVDIPASDRFNGVPQAFNPAEDRPRIILRADIDALPVEETTGLPFASTNGFAHACGHDIHTTVVIGAGLALADLAAAGDLPNDVRLIFQPAEEVHPGGAIDVIEQGALLPGAIIYAVHAEPRLDVGKVGTRVGELTSASDSVTVTLNSRGGHTSRPHLTGDLVYALGQVITQTPAMLGRRLDPRSGVNLTWGQVKAGTADNAIPARGVLSGTLRCLDSNVWEDAGRIVTEIVESVVAPTGVTAECVITRGVPPVVNTEHETIRIGAAARDANGAKTVVLSEQSLGGEDFGWYLMERAGSMIRLGTRTPGERTYDLHQGDVIFDERAINVGVRTLATVAAMPLGVPKS